MTNLGRGGPAPHEGMSYRNKGTYRSVSSSPRRTTRFYEPLSPAGDRNDGLAPDGLSGHVRIHATGPTAGGTSYHVQGPHLQYVARVGSQQALGAPG
jgi:hypothetical protein